MKQSCELQTQWRSVMKKMLLITLLAVSMLIGIALHDFVDAGADDSTETASLKAAHRKYLQAWTDRDFDTIVEMGTGAAGFGHSTAFPRPVRVKEPFRAGVTKFFDMMDVFSITVHTENYRVVGNTGMAWGHLSYTTKQKDGPQRQVYQRYTHIFSNVTGKWTLVMYHRSIMTSEDLQ